MKELDTNEDVLHVEQIFLKDESNYKKTKVNVYKSCFCPILTYGCTAGQDDREMKKGTSEENVGKFNSGHFKRKKCYMERGE